MSSQQDFKTTIEIPGTSLQVCRLGLGCSRLFGGSEARDSSRIIEAAVSAGILHFDTAAAYAYGRSEEVVGEILEGVAGVTVTTKVGIEPVDAPKSGMRVLYRRIARPLLARIPRLKAALLRAAKPQAAQPDSKPELRVLGRDDLLRSVERSLRKLRRSSLDILLLHEPDKLLVDDTLKLELEALLANGTVKAFGLGLGRPSFDDPELGRVLQCRYDPARPSGPPLARQARIFHGVLRTAAQGEAAVARPASAGLAIRRVLDQWPGTAVIFSASAPSQVREVARDCFANVPGGS